MAWKIWMYGTFPLNLLFCAIVTITDKAFAFGWFNAALMALLAAISIKSLEQNVSAE